MDSLRAETSTNGRFNTPEYGTVEDPELFTVLLAYSPYHNVADGTAYPAVLLTAGENDTRVDAWHARKMTARLLEATSSDRPVLLRLERFRHRAAEVGQQQHRERPERRECSQLRIANDLVAQGEHGRHDDRCPGGTAQCGKAAIALAQPSQEVQVHQPHLRHLREPALHI
jgi:hypothetical protein